MPNPETSFKIVEIHTDNVTSALRGAANDILMRNFQAGRLDRLVAESVSEPGEVATFLKGMEIGMAYGFGLVVSGKVNLQVVKVKTPG